MEERDDGVPPLDDASSESAGHASGPDAIAHGTPGTRDFGPGSDRADLAGAGPAPRPQDTGADGVRIAAVEAAVAAGLAPSTGRRPDQAPAGDPAELREGLAELFAPLELPDWSDPPTGQVPRILLGAEDADAVGDGSALRGPTWREDRADWEQDLDLTFLVDADDASGIAGHAAHEAAHPFDDADFDIDDEAWASLLDGALPVPAGAAEPSVSPRPHRSRAGRGGTRPRDKAAGDDRGGVGPERSSRAPHAAHSARRARRHVPGQTAESGAARAGSRRSPVKATATGVVAGAIALGCFLAGPVASLVLVTVLVTLAAGEAFGTLRRAGRDPATLLGLLAIPALVVGSYFRGPEAVPLVLGLVMILTFCWYLLDAVGTRGARRSVTNLGATVLVVTWLGVLGSFAGLLLDPAAYPRRHGVALLVAAVALTIAADVGAYVTGSLVGRHPLATRISPNKSWEGLVGGAVLTIVVAAVVVARIHPFTLAHALLLGAVVAVVAPIGDLAESLVKRDLGVKDMGSLLPAHGGVLDRVDAMLFVLPAAYYLARIVHLA